MIILIILYCLSVCLSTLYRNSIYHIISYPINVITIRGSYVYTVCTVCTVHSSAQGSGYTIYYYEGILWMDTTDEWMNKTQQYSK